MTKFTLNIAVCILSGFLAAQEGSGKWSTSLAGNVNTTQNNFDNWTPGGESAWSWQSDLNGSAVRDGNAYNLANTGKFSFGKTRIGKKESRKSADEIKLESVLTLKRFRRVNPYASTSAQTQMAKGFKYPGDTSRVEVSDFIDPLYLTQSTGLGFILLDRVKTRSGFSLKETLTRNHPVPYSDNPTTADLEKFKFEYGIELVADYRNSFGENLQVNSRIQLFSNLKGLVETDVDWDTMITAKVTKYVSTSFNFRLIFDKDLSSGKQMKQTLSLGLAYVII